MSATGLLSFARRLVGASLPRAEADAQRLPSLIALPILSSDALSSVAYATEVALGVLILAGSAAAHGLGAGRDQPALQTGL